MHALIMIKSTELLDQDLEERIDHIEYQRSEQTEVTLDFVTCRYPTLLMISGGSGIVPLTAILRDILHSHHSGAEVGLPSKVRN